MSTMKFVYYRQLLGGTEAFSVCCICSILLSYSVSVAAAVFVAAVGQYTLRLPYFTYILHDVYLTLRTPYLTYIYVYRTLRIPYLTYTTPYLTLVSKAVFYPPAARCAMEISSRRSGLPGCLILQFDICCILLCKPGWSGEPCWKTSSFFFFLFQSKVPVRIFAGSGMTRREDLDIYDSLP